MTDIIDLAYALSGVSVALWSIGATIFRLMSSDRRERAVLIKLAASLPWIALEVRYEREQRRLAQ